MYVSGAELCRDYHIYQNIWTSSVEILNHERELQNHEDPYAVATKTSSAVVRHVPCSVSCINFYTMMDPLAVP